MEQQINKRLVTINGVRNLEAGLPDKIEFGGEYEIRFVVSPTKMETIDNGDGTVDLVYKVAPVGFVSVTKKSIEDARGEQTL